MLNVFLRLVRQQKIISFHKHVTHSGFTLIGVKLIDGVGGQVNIWSHKKASCEVAYRDCSMRVSAIWMLCSCGCAHAYTSGLNWMPLFTTVHTYICTRVQMTQSVYYVFSPKYNHTHTHTQRYVSPTTAVCLWAVSLGKVIGPCLSWNEPRVINTCWEIYPWNKAPIQKQVKLCNTSIYC